MTRFRRGSASPRDASLAPTLSTAPLATLLQRPPLACPLLPDDRLALRSIRLSHVPPLSLRRSPHALAAYTRLTTTLSTRRPSPQTRRTVHRPRDLSAKALPPPHRSLRSHRGELAGPLSRDDVHAAGAQCSVSLRSSSLRPLTARSVRAARNLFHGTPHHHAALPTPLRAPPPAARLLCTRPGMLATLHAPLHRSARAPHMPDPPPTRSHLHSPHYRLAVSSLTSPPPPPCAF